MTTTMIKRFLLFLPFFFPFFQAGAQSIPVDSRFGKVSVKECEMSVYPADTSAAALVLCEQHTVKIDFDESIGEPLQWITHSERIKILKDRGKDRADYSLLIPSTNQEGEAFVGLTVVTYNLEKGKVVQTKLPKSDIYRVKYNKNLDKITFAAPNVKAGSVIEVRYSQTVADFFSIDDFYFQRDIPVNLCTYTVSLPLWLDYRIVSHGFEPVASKKWETTGVNLQPVVSSNMLDVEEYKAVDLPGMDNEPGVYCIRQYRTALTYTITGLNFGSTHRTYSKTWEDVDELVRKSAIFDKIKAGCRFKEEVDAAMAAETPQEQISNIIKLVRNKVAWDKTYRLVPTDGQEAIRNHSGSSADINALVASAARYAGFRVAPVLLSARTRGVLLDYHPTPDSFSKFILRFDLNDGQALYVDAADPNGWLNVLNPNDLVTRGRMIPDDGPGTWVDLTNLGRNVESFVVEAELSTDGTLKGECTASFRGIASYDFKTGFLRHDKEEDAIEELERRYSAEIEDFTAQQLREYGDNASMHFRFEKTCEGSGDVIYVKPYLADFHNESLFRAETRKMPVDFSYPEQISYTFRLILPEGYVVEQMPERKRLASGLPSSVTVMPSVNDRVVMLSYRFDLNTLVGLAQNYEDIRAYWKALCGLYGQMIVVKKAS